MNCSDMCKVIYVFVITFRSLCLRSLFRPLRWKDNYGIMAKIKSSLIFLSLPSSHSLRALPTAEFTFANNSKFILGKGTIRLKAEVNGKRRHSEIPRRLLFTGEREEM